MSDSPSSAGQDMPPAQPEDGSAVSESSYTDYLLQARRALEQCAQACRNWSAPYDGENPPPDSILEHPSGGAGDDVVDAVNTKEGGVEKKSDVSLDSVGERPRSHSAVKLLSHGNVTDSGQAHLPDSETLQQQVNGSKRRTDGASSSGDSGSAAESQSSSNSPSVISEALCNKVLASSLAPSSSPSPPSNVPKPLGNVDLAKLNSCLNDLDSFLAYLSELDLATELSSQTLEESLTALEGLLSSLAMKKDAAQEASGRRPTDRARNPSQDREGSRAEKQSSVPSADPPASSSAASSSASTTSAASVKKSPAPPKTLGLAPAMDVSVGGKCYAVLPSWAITPDDGMRALIMSPTSPGFLLSPSSSSSSSAARLIPPAVKYSNSPPNIGKTCLLPFPLSQWPAFFAFSISSQLLPVCGSFGVEAMLCHVVCSWFRGCVCVCVYVCVCACRCALVSVCVQACVGVLMCLMWLKQITVLITIMLCEIGKKKNKILHL